MTQPVDRPVTDGVPAQGVGTPFQSRGPVPAQPAPLDGLEEALATLEFEAVLLQVAERAAGPAGAASVLARRPTDDLAWIRRELARAGEIAALLRRGEEFTPEPLGEVKRPLGRLRVEGSVLEAAELAALRQVLTAARRVDGELRRVAEQAPATAELRRPLPDRRIDRRLELSVEPDGTLLDTASPALAGARREVHHARERLLRKLEGMLRDSDGGAVTIRNGRYVIPVRRDARQRPSGIIHDESASAGTLFIEPTAAVELGNALREAHAAEERETLRVLRELTELLRPEYPLLRDAAEMVTAVDDLAARARWAVEVEGEVPEVVAAPAPLSVVHGRHPLLLAQPGPVIPFDLALSDGERTLLVSGPNTGGKTVLLKAVALACLLAQSGIVPPVGPGTALPRFRRCFADIGDRQSIAASLSTFSAHLATLRRVLDEADDETLVLLDEVGSGTDPLEGAALAAAALMALVRRGSVTLATTHLGSLKGLAATEPAVVNGSLQFDSATLTPTYRFQKGVPGRSYGLAIARRLGVDPAVLADAEGRVPSVERDLDALLAAAEARQQELAEEATIQAERTIELDALAARLARQQEEQEARDTELRRREREAERQGRQQARQYLLDARQRVEEALGAAREAADQAAARVARRLVEEGITEAGEALNESEPERAAPADGAPEPGRRVRVRGANGVVQEVRPDGRLVVTLGAMRLVVDAAEAEPLAGQPPERSRPVAQPDRAAPEAPMEVDLRGLTGDEAEAAALAAIDAAVLAERPFLRIIHGMGTGVVRERVRRVAAGDRRIAKYDFAPRNQGGTGVTVLEFRP